MFCQNCFKSVRSGVQVCEHCGAEIECKTYKVPTNKDVDVLPALGNEANPCRIYVTAL